MMDKVKMAVFVLILGTVLTLALVGVEAYTAPRIEKNRLRKLQSSVLAALNIPAEAEELEETFQAKVTVKSHRSGSYYISGDGTIAFEIEGSGLWGPIEGVLAMSADMARIRGITIVHQEETPGLGSRIAEPEYLGKFVGKTFTPRLEVTAPGKAQADNQVEAITGATLSCKALEGVLNKEATRNISLIEEAAQ